MEGTESVLSFEGPLDRNITGEKVAGLYILSVLINVINSMQTDSKAAHCLNVA
jgi:hypothetical protein